MSDAFIVVGLGYGDEGKGSTVDAITRTTGARLVVRFSGGPQCAHTVVCSDGRWHTFAQFGSGTFAGAKTYLSRFMLVEPFALLNEHEVLAPKVGRSALKDVYIEAGSPVITPFHWLTQRLRAGTKGASCGVGLGELRADQVDNQPVMTAGDLADWDWTKRYFELRRIRERKIEQVLAFGGDASQLEQASLYSILYAYERFAKKVNIVPNGRLREMADGPVVFEGNQGVLLDEIHGSAPFNTWTDTTFRNADRLLDGLGMDVHRVGVVRTYFTRHGAGPFVTEYETGPRHPEPHNATGEWQGVFRQGRFDARAVRYAIDVCGGVDSLAVTHCDRLGDWFTYADGEKGSVFDYDPIYTMSRKALPDLLPKIVGAEVGWLSHGPCAEHKMALVAA